MKNFELLYEEEDCSPVYTLVKSYGSAVYGVNAMTITMEVALSSGWKRVLVGLPDNAVRESLFRIETALKSANHVWPRQKVLINMAPADIKKEGASYDLPIALSLLAGSGKITATKLEHYVIMGELSLDGKLKPIKGSLPMAIQAKSEGFKGMLLPKENAREAAIVEGIEIYGVETLTEAIGWMQDDITLTPIYVDTELEFKNATELYAADFSDVQGQENIKRAMEIAAAGGHNIILIGPPGAGKTMLAKRLPTILPPMTLDEALEATKIHSVAGKLNGNTALICKRPFRSPHHTISDVALVGGGGNPQPGEISLAHNGVLFLDELPEFKRTVLEVMRQPMEEGKVTVSRAKISVDFQARFQLVASCNPCPCGFYTHPEKTCVCGPGIVQKYLNRVSGPLLDRIDLHVEVTPVSFSEMTTYTKSESSEMVRARVISAREVQKKRFTEKGLHNIYSNAMMSTNMVKEECSINQAGKLLLKTAMEKLGLSARAYDRILKVSRTIADLSNSKDILTEHLAEAIHYRSLDRDNWAG